jgi:hypothetical protein
MTPAPGPGPRPSEPASRKTDIRNDPGPHAALGTRTATGPARVNSGAAPALPPPAPRARQPSGEARAAARRRATDVRLAGCGLMAGRDLGPRLPTCLSSLAGADFGFVRPLVSAVCGHTHRPPRGLNSIISIAIELHNR